MSIARAVGEEDKLYGSVTTRDIAEALHEKGVTVDSKKIQLAEPIKALGDFEVDGQARSRRATRRSRSRSSKKKRSRIAKRPAARALARQA